MVQYLSLFMTLLLSLSLIGCDSQDLPSETDAERTDRILAEMNEMEPLIQSYKVVDLSLTTEKDRAEMKSNLDSYSEMAEFILNSEPQDLINAYSDDLQIQTNMALVEQVQSNINTYEQGLTVDTRSSSNGPE